MDGRLILSIELLILAVNTHKTCDGANAQVIPKVSFKEDHITVLHGTNVTLNCHVTGEPSPNITWLFDDGHIQSENIHTSKDKLYIAKSQPLNEGEYKCVGSNAFGHDQAKMKVYVVGQPPKFDTLPKSEYVSFGYSVTFYCHASGIPLPNIYWYFVTTDGEAAFPSSFTVNSDYTEITLTRPAQSGTIYCVARNEYGTTHTSASLYIGRPGLVG